MEHMGKKVEGAAPDRPHGQLSGENGECGCGRFVQLCGVCVFFFFCQDSLYSDLLSFLLSLCTREHDTHLDVVNAQAP